MINNISQPKYDFSETTDHELNVRELTLRLELIAIEKEKRSRCEKRGTSNTSVKQSKLKVCAKLNDYREVKYLGVKDVNSNQIKVGHNVRILSRTKSKNAPFYGVTQALVTGLDHRNWIKLEVMKQNCQERIILKSTQIPRNVQIIDERELSHLNANESTKAITKRC